MSAPSILWSPPTRARFCALVSLFVLLTGVAVPVAVSQDDAGPGADREWRFIQKLEQDGMADLAVRQLEEFATDYPRDPRAPGALLRAGDGWRELGQSVAAKGAYEKLLSRFPSSDEAPTAALHRADLLVDEERWAEAAEAYRSLLSSYPASAEIDEARLGLGESLMALRQDEEAGRLFQRLIAGRASPSISARAQFDLGLLAQRAGEDSVAIVRFEAVHRQHPSELIGAFGLLRAAELLVAREAPTAARQRYRSVLSDYEEPLLRARARLGLAALLEEDDPRAAADQYEKVAEEGGTPEQLRASLIGRARASLAAGKNGDARKAADLFIAEFPDGAEVPRARLLAARADLAENREGVEATLLGLGESVDRDVGYQALMLLAQRYETDAADFEAALDVWRKAERVAPGPDRRARSLLGQTRMAMRLGRASLAADTARQAHAAAGSDSLRARSLLRAASASASAGHLGEAIALAERLAQEHPLTPDATEGRALLRTLRRRAQRDPEGASRALAELAETPFEDQSERSVAVGRVLRDQLGDAAAARVAFERAAERAGSPAQRARARVEAGIARQREALELGLAGDAREARKALGEARSLFADAASDAGTTRVGATAKVYLIGLDLAQAARPSQPWLFDASSMPLLGAVGEAESVDLASSALDATRERLASALESTEDGDARAWMIWRWAELSAVPAEERAARLEALLSSGGDRELELRYTLGLLRLEAGDAAAAARELNRVIERAPAGELAMAARYGLAEAQRSEKRWSQAAKLYAEYATTYPATQRGQRSLLLSGDCALFAGDAETAVERYRQLLTRYPDSVYQDDALYRLGTALQRTGRIEAAREPFEQLAAMGSGSEYRGRGLAKLAEIEEAAGRDDVAIEVLGRLVEADPERAEKVGAVVRVARLELDRGRGAEALAWLDRLQREDDDPDRMALRISALAATGRSSAAAEVLESLSRGFPDRGFLIAQSRLDLADAYAEQGRGQAAVESYRAAAAESTDPELRARAAYGEGLVHARAGEFANARASWDAARRADPRSSWAAEALYKLGGLAARSGDAGDAQRAFAALVEGFPDHPKAPDALKAEARAWREMGRFDEALEIYHRVLEEYPEAPGSEDVLSNIAYCHHELGHFEVAIAAYERVQPYLDEEGQGYAQFWIADSLDRLGRHEEAAAAFLRIPYLYPGLGQLPVTAQLKAAEVYEKMGQPDAAVRLYEKVVDSHGVNSQWGAEAKRRLDRLAGSEQSGS